MISHNTKCVNLPTEPTAGLTETLFERCGRPFAHEQVPAVVAPVNDVITRARKFDSHLSWHPVRAFRTELYAHAITWPTEFAVDAAARYHDSRHDPVRTVRWRAARVRPRP